MALNLSFAFDPQKGQTPQSIAQQRQLANIIAARISGTTPKNVGEGIGSIGDALMFHKLYGDADAAQKAGEASLPDFLKSLITGQPAVPSVSTPMGLTSIPPGEIDPRLSSAISGAASSSGVDPAYMTRLALVENGGKVEGGSPLSSAKGPFQFLSGTAKQYGLANPNDPTASANAAARLTLDNKAALTNALGREPTPGELYLAHQQGAGGAIKLLQNPNAPVESVIGAQAARNNAATPGMTAGQFTNKWTGKFGDIVQTVDPNQKNIIDAQADAPMAFAGQPAGAASADMAVGSPAAAPAAVQPATQPQNRFLFKNASDEDLVKALMNPFAKDFHPMILQEYKLRADAAQKAADPMRALDMRLKQGQLSAMPIDLQGKRLANMKIERELQGEGATPLSPEERQSYGIPAEQPAYKTRTGEIKFGPAAVKITNNAGSGESAFSKKGSELQATRFNDLVSDGQGARQMMSDISTLVDLGKNIGTGKGAQFKSALGPYAEAAGVKIEGLSDIQAYESIVNRMAPALRVKGSGSQSDTELRNFLKSLPSIGNTTEGNEIVASVMQGLTQNKILAADIASKALNGEISRSDAEKQLRELPDPMQPYRDYKASRSKVDSLLQKYGPR